jgi:group II intron reverse transcriptase/maturase
LDLILEPPGSVQKLQGALQAKAKGAPGDRFYLLYDKLDRKDVLEHAYRRCKANKGAPGVDGQELADIEAYGEERWLGELAEALRRKMYRAEAVKRVWIPKAGGKLRPLGIPRIADRVVMMAAVVVLEPIFEADMPAEQHGYRQNFSAHTAVKEVDRLINSGHTQVVEADLADYFGSIPHAELLKSVARRVSDRHLLHRIEMWLDTPVEEDDGKGGTKRTTVNRDSGRGVPQGAPISPLLANLYMRRFVLGWKKRGLETKLGAKVVVYADDLVICCRRGHAHEAMVEMRSLLERLKLTVNEAKTKIRELPNERFDFLGYSFGRYPDFVNWGV